MTLTLVTGGAGFIGSHLVDALVSRGDEVIIADDLRLGSLANVEQSMRGGRTTFVYLDVRQSTDSLRTSILKGTRFKKISRIFHLAPSESIDSLIDISIEMGARLIYASSLELGADRHVEGHKDPSEAAISFAATRHGLDARLVRLFDCYGPRMAKSDGSGVFYALADAIVAGTPLLIHGEGLQRCSMTFVVDAVQLLLIVADESQAGLLPVCIGCDEEYTVLQVAESLARVAGVPFVVKHTTERPYESKRCNPDLTLVRSMGDVTLTPLDRGLATTIAWLRDNAGVYA